MTKNIFAALLIVCLGLSHWAQAQVVPPVSAPVATPQKPTTSIPDLNNIGQNDGLKSGLMPFQKRVFFKKRLEPEHVIVHGAGQQDHPSFTNYAAALPADAQPALYMHYHGLSGLKKGEKLRKKLIEIGSLASPAIPQLGLSMTTDGKPETHYEQDVAAGKYDAEIDTLIQVLKWWNRPIYIRLGYEFNGFWNGYEATTYKAAFQYVVQRMRKAGLDRNVAIVWCFAVDSDEDDFMRFYPGDAYVDWWSVDVFSAWHYKQKELWAYLDSAKAHKFPVLIGESTPRRLAVQKGDSSWHLWFVPYFNMIRTQPHIKATGYINWNWKGTPWPDWGDSRIEAAPATLRERYIQEMKQPWWLHSTEATSSFILGKSTQAVPIRELKGTTKVK